MYLIKKSGYKRYENCTYKQSFGIFHCPFCNKRIEKSLSHGKRDKSCGCLHPMIMHGDRRKKLYGIWRGIKRRCNSPYEPSFNRYGGRGIKVCEQWKEYIIFRKWALETGYKENLTIHRINNDEDYYPLNCKWITKSEHSSLTGFSRRQITLRKLTPIQAREIKIEYKKGFITLKGLSLKYRISIAAIQKLVTYQTYKEILP